ncbi:MAG: hypothetical protein AAGK14_14735 [Verrucomicrobiota bacterium]
MNLKISEDVQFELVAQSSHKYQTQEIGFGDHARILVAIGGLANIQHGMPYANVCFATLFYSPEQKLITMDFSKMMT